MHTYLPLLLCCVVVLPLYAGEPIDEPVVAGGKVRGEWLAGDTPVYVLRGVPFAAPPVGDLRWRPPQPVEPWQGVRACTQFGPACPQPRQRGVRDVGKQSEDCLYLNVWTPARRRDARLPVMVWIHGGGCTTGAGHLPIYDGAALARRGVVVVTINYRLGPLGFLAHPLLSKESEHGVSGNYGMLDQIAALQWVQQHIAQLGGDPGNVTVFGESAGSASIARLLVSPLAKGLFHKAIMQSGGLHGRNRHLRKQVGQLEPMERVGEQIAAKLGCDKAADPLAAMRAVPASRLLSVSDPVRGLFGRGIKFGWVVDGYAIPDDPVALLEAGKFHAMPIIVGSNANEGTIFLQSLPIRSAAGYKRVVQQMFGKQAAAVLAAFPTGNGDAKAALDRLITVSAFVLPARALARETTRRGQPAYVYHFTRQGPRRDLGAFHALEIPYVFRNLPATIARKPTDRALSEAMCDAWVRFAKTGNPAGGAVQAWPAWHAADEPYLDFGDTVTPRAGLFVKECDLLEAAKPTPR